MIESIKKEWSSLELYSISSLISKNLPATSSHVVDEMMLFFSCCCCSSWTRYTYVRTYGRSLTRALIISHLWFVPNERTNEIRFWNHKEPTCLRINQKHKYRNKQINEPRCVRTYKSKTQIGTNEQRNGTK